METLIVNANFKELTALWELMEDVQKFKIVNKLLLEKPALKE